VGYTSAAKPLYETVRDAAVMAATRDTRFLPVGREELSTIRYEISVLSPLRRVMKVDEIVVGRDGLLVKNGGREGLLLPQVATEYGWDRGLFLEQTCVKAGLSRDAWKDEETDIFRFHAIVFHEE
jgi:AmmeMemoRadiSam system protein A